MSHPLLVTEQCADALQAVRLLVNVFRFDSKSRRVACISMVLVG
jgi:hypothetical protein